MLISVIIVNHNTPEVLKECLESVYRFEDTSVMEIVIIDNASGDNSRGVINELALKYLIVKYVFLDELKSFSYANNRGIEKACGEFILIMNPDIIFTEPVLGKLVKLLESNPGTGAVSPALTGTDGKFQRNYFQRYPSLRQFIYYHSLAAKLFNRSVKRMNRYLENQDIDVTTRGVYFTEQIPCAFFLTGKNILTETGLLDEKFILFFEDVDLSYRYNKKYKLAVDTSVKVTHIGGSSFKSEGNWNLYGLYVHSMIYFFKKHYTRTRALTLRVMVKINSYLILFTEKVKQLFNKQNNYRIKKHRHLLKLMKETA